MASTSLQGSLGRDRLLPFLDAPRRLPAWLPESSWDHPGARCNRHRSTPIFRISPVFIHFVRLSRPFDVILLRHLDVVFLRVNLRDYVARNEATHDPQARRRTRRAWTSPNDSRRRSLLGATTVPASSGAALCESVRPSLRHFVSRSFAELWAF
jgi:hypothetical protein